MEFIFEIHANLGVDRSKLWVWRTFIRRNARLVAKLIFFKRMANGAHISLFMASVPNVGTF